jgi:hypothetical protein
MNHLCNECEKSQMVERVEVIKWGGKKLNSCCCLCCILLLLPSKMVNIKELKGRKESSPGVLGRLRNITNLFIPSREIRRRFTDRVSSILGFGLSGVYVCGNIAWVLGTSIIVLFFPLYRAMTIEAMYVEDIHNNMHRRQTQYWGDQYVDVMHQDGMQITQEDMNPNWWQEKQDKDAVKGFQNSYEEGM